MGTCVKMDNRIIDRADVRQALDTFKEHGSRQSLVELGNLCRKDNNVLSDRELMLEIIDAAKGRDPKIAGLIAHFVKGHVRTSNNQRLAGRHMIMDITGMKKSSYYGDKSPLELDIHGDKKLSEKEKVALSVIGPAFLEDTEAQRFSQFSKDWDNAAKISFAEEIGIADEHLFSLGRWFTSLAVNCRETLNAKQSEIILVNVERINDIVGEHHYHGVRIPDFLYELSGAEKPNTEQNTLAL